MFTTLAEKKSDTLGAISSALCMIHCIATPFFFFVSACSTSCCSTAPVWWKMLDYIFLVISFIAVRQSTNSTNSKLIFYGLYASWIGLFLFILNVNFRWLDISDNTKFIPAFALIGFHIYNFKYCQCNIKKCC